MSFSQVVKPVITDWYLTFKDLWDSQGLETLMKELHQDKIKYGQFPVEHQIFDAFRFTTYSNVKIVFMGMCPYHTAIHHVPHANGLCFDCSQPIDYQIDGLTPSFQKIYEEYSRYDKTHFNTSVMDGRLRHWARKGVLLLNAALTVRPNQAGSHNMMWAPFIKGLLSRMKTRNPQLHIIAFGNQAYDLCASEEWPHLTKVVHPSYSARRGEDWRPFGEENFFDRMDALTNNQIDW